jgi:amino acid permease|tara:strand:+ start:369 stop:617 length:249 start_codon:yes stop_codon:yes gene_type:complete
MKTLKQFLKGFKKGMKIFGNNIAIIINTLLLFFVYIIGVGFTSIIAKLFRKHFLETKLSKKDSYWSDLNLKKKPIEKYYRQF